jgi:hypothetical protein
VHVVKTIPAVVAGAIGLLVLAAVSGCGRSEQTSAAPSSDTAAAVSAASSAEASASDAEAAAALARAKLPAAGTAANAAGENQKPPPSVNVAEQAQAAGDEAPQELRNKVNAAKDAGRAPVQQ